MYQAPYRFFLQALEQTPSAAMAGSASDTVPPVPQERDDQVPPVPGSSSAWLAPVPGPPASKDIRIRHGVPAAWAPPPEPKPQASVPKSSVPKGPAPKPAPREVLDDEAKAKILEAAKQEVQKRPAPPEIVKALREAEAEQAKAKAGPSQVVQAQAVWMTVQRAEDPWRTVQPAEPPGPPDRAAPDGPWAPGSRAEDPWDHPHGLGLLENLELQVPTSIPQDMVDPGSHQEFLETMREALEHTDMVDHRLQLLQRLTENFEDPPAWMTLQPLPTLANWAKIIEQNFPDLDHQAIGGLCDLIRTDDLGKLEGCRILYHLFKDRKGKGKGHEGSSSGWLIGTVREASQAIRNQQSWEGPWAKGKGNQKGSSAASDAGPSAADPAGPSASGPADSSSSSWWPGQGLR